MLTSLGHAIRPFKVLQSDSGRRSSHAASKMILTVVLTRCGEGLGFARCSPELDVGLQILHHAIELGEVQ